MKLVQVEFTREDTDGTAHQIAWIDKEWKLEENDVVSFKGETELWAVLKVYDTILEMAQLEKKWGLALPRSQRTER